MSQTSSSAAGYDKREASNWELKFTRAHVYKSAWKGDWYIQRC